MASFFFVNFAALFVKVKTKHICDPPSLNDTVVGYFDGVKKDGYCGEGMILRLDMKQSFQLCMYEGRGSRTRAELPALWGLLFFSRSR